MQTRTWLRSRGNTIEGGVYKEHRGGPAKVGSHVLMKVRDEPRVHFRAVDGFVGVPRAARAEHGGLLAGRIDSPGVGLDEEDRKSTRLNSSHT